MENEDTLIGLRIFDLRVERDINQNELAAALQMHVSVLNRIEKGSRPIRGTELRLIAQYFQVSADFLLGIDAKQNHQTQTPAKGKADCRLRPAPQPSLLAPDEKILLQNYRHLDDRGRTAVQKIARWELQYTQGPEQTKNANILAENS